ncbi:uncharacterized protein LOC123557071 [Mercenaria mercenaria]|uniref:uncharacterized protein LOC123557071 n=1 Tax=Mercenaria mercenaria TaxID=6596 RepID=UPI00234E487A|nr:uncharacterized protein LOC123557071 [Mercenaria mercenaria]
MDSRLVWLSGSICLLNVAFVKSEFDKYGHFKVLKQHPDLRQCAAKELQQNGVGGRISDLTGVCEVLSHSWGRNPTVEPGYGYVKNIYVRETFEPEVGVEYMTWIIPGVLNSGAKLDVHFRWPKSQWAYYSFVLTEGLTEQYSDTDGQVMFGTDINGEGRLTYFEKRENGARIPDTSDTVKEIVPSAECKITFVARKSSLQILVNDEVVKERSLKVVRLNHIRQISIKKFNSNLFGDSNNLLSLRRFEFTEA